MKKMFLNFFVFHLHKTKDDVMITNLSFKGNIVTLL